MPDNVSWGSVATFNSWDRYERYRSELDGDWFLADLKVRSARIVLESLEVQADIGFHDFEIGSPQRLLVTVEIWLDESRRARRRRSGARVEL